MSHQLRLGLVGLNQTPAEWSENARRIRTARDQALEQGARIIIFPELTVTGYSCEDLFLHPGTADRAMAITLELAAECGDEVLLVGLPFRYRNNLYNGVAVLNKGRICGISAKSNLAREGIHYEPRWFLPWPLGERATLTIAGREVPIGTLSYRVADMVFVLEICEDAWVDPHNRPCSRVGHAQWVFNTSASHFSMRKADIREKILVETTRYYNVGYVYTNLVGCESGRAIYDGELMVARDGAIVNRSDRLYLDEIKLLFHDITTRDGAIGADVLLETTPPEKLPPISQPDPARRIRETNDEFAMAATLALFDYMRKCRARGFTLSLSGGVDSSVVAALVWIMAHRLCNELEPHESERRMAWFSDLGPIEDPRQLTGRLLTTVYQSTRNSGPVTRRAATELSAAIGARHLELDVDALVQTYTEKIGEAVGRPLTWETDDIALQNIQARVRAPGVWMLANMSGSLLLSTSNRSEVAVGYATMDGDTAGGLSPIAGVEKTFLRSWLRVLEEKGLTSIPALPALSHVNNQQPTAELRPPEQTQTDEDDLMPYEVLDALEASLIARRLTPKASLERVLDLMGDRYSREQCTIWTRKFCRMFATTQWKRERYAPAFHLDDSNLDPKTWARYPILSGAYGDELKDL